MIPFQPISRPQATVRASLLALLIPLGAALTVCVEADSAKADIRTDLTSYVYAMERDWIRFEAIYRPDGELDVRSNLGRFHGEWMIAGNELCVAFDNGPAMGLRCSVVSAQDGELRLAEGQTLRRVARIRHFDE